MPYVESYQRGLSHCTTSYQDLVHRVAKQRSVGRQVGSHRDSPESDLIPGEQVAGETQEERHKEQPHADHPVELSRWSPCPKKKNTNHMQRYRDHHAVSRPAVHV